jgi:hypothetical protein
MPAMKTANIPLPRVSFGKRKQRSQMCEVFTDDGRIILVEHEVLRGCVADYQKGMGFILDSDNQMVNEDGYWSQVLGERCTIPMCMIKPSNIKDLRALVNQISHETRAAAKMAEYEKANKNKFMEKIIWIVGMPISAFLLIYMANKFWG